MPDHLNGPIGKVAGSAPWAEAYVRFGSILLKNSEIEGRREFRFHALRVIYASSCPVEAYDRVAHSKPDRSAEPLRKFPSSLPAVF
jgi:hypothetical protein